MWTRAVLFTELSCRVHIIKCLDLLEDRAEPKPPMIDQKQTYMERYHVFLQTVKQRPDGLFTAQALICSVFPPPG